MAEVILKMAGGGLLCLSCSLLGVYFSRRDGYRINDLNELKKILLILKSEIAFAHNLLPEALLNAGGRADRRVGGFFTAISGRMSERDGADLREIWDDGLKRGFSGSHLKDEDVETVSRLGRIIGYLDKALQTDGLEMAIGEISGTVNRLIALRERNGRLYRSLGVLGGLLITVMIL